MHLADGIVAHVPVVIGLNVLGACAVGTAFNRSVRHEVKSAAWTGTLAAFVLVAQALNLPLLPGASAHAIGAGLLTLAVGPARAIVALFAVLVVQALLLADGGITVLGINALNVAVLPVLVMQLCRRLLGESPRRLALAAIIGTPLGSIAGASSLTVALVTGAAAPLGLTAGWLLGVQAAAGLIEGVITALAVKQLSGQAPALLQRSALVQRGGRLSLDQTHDIATTPQRPRLQIAALALAVTLALIPLASAKPDALQIVIQCLQGTR